MGNDGRDCDVCWDVAGGLLGERLGGRVHGPAGWDGLRVHHWGVWLVLSLLVLAGLSRGSLCLAPWFALVCSIHLRIFAQISGVLPAEP